jgi:hypothetical protein
MLSNTKSLLVVTAVIDLVAGILLLITPSLMSKLLLGAPDRTATTLPVARAAVRRRSAGDAQSVRRLDVD